MNLVIRKNKLLSRFLFLCIMLGLIAARGIAQTVEDRITSILNQMMMDEKIKQLHAEGGFNTADNMRLRIPGFIMADGPHGVRDGLATSFPVGIGMASTWDVELAQRVGVAMGKEFRGKGKHQALGPCLDIDRDTRNGRSPETGGEDPYLCAQITTAVVKGIQSTPCIATIKHYNANHREDGRMTNNITASQRVLHDDAGLAFRTAVQQGGAFCVMNAYNLINNEKCAENYNLLTTILRTHWGFPYYVVSDWGSIWSAERAIKAGCDICMGSDDYKNNLPALVASGAVSQSVIDEAVRRVLRTKILSGMLDYQPPGNPDDVNCAAHNQLCLEAGRKSLVLLKNQDNILPLNKGTINSVALIGPSAAILQIDGTGSAYVTPYYTITPKQGIEEKIGASKVLYTKGCEINSVDTSGFTQARTIASASDVVIYCGGLDGSQEGEGFDRVGGSVQLPGKQQALINALAAVNKNIVVVLFSGGVCTVDINQVRGFIYAFYPGQEGGRALADVLFGDYNPGGKLPVTFPYNAGQLPAWLQNDDFNTGYGRGYRWFDKTGFIPRYAFGHGLSYTTFSYSNLHVTPQSVSPGQQVNVSVDVTNTGVRIGDEVVQLYMSDTLSTMPTPVKQLKGFKRLTLTPGQTSTVTFTLTADELYYFNEINNSYEVEPGQFIVRIGGSSDNLSLSGSFQVLDNPRKPDLLITNVKMVPPYPFPGQKVMFLATVKNQGTAATTGDTPLKASFTVNGQSVCWSDEFSSSIPAGGMALICGNAGPNGVNIWTATAVGSYNVGVVIDPDNTVDECVETNNSFLSQLIVYPMPPTNLALNKPVVVSSIERTGLEGSNAVDGNMGTRWASAFSDPQHITIDLGAMNQIDDVVLYWENAYAKEYILQISDGIGEWTDVKHETNGDGGIDKITVGTQASLVRVLGIQRATEWGYSIYEIEVYGTEDTNVDAGPEHSLPWVFSLSNSYPNPFNPTTTIQFEIPAHTAGGLDWGLVTLRIYDLLGREAATLVNEEKPAGNYTVHWDASNFPSGVYFAVLNSGTQRASTRMVLLK
jgi:beta-glucosidase